MITVIRPLSASNIVIIIPFHKYVDKDANGKLLREEGKPSLWSQRRTVIRNRSKIRENVRMSLQTLNISDVARRLAGIYAQKDSQHRRKNCKVAGMMHVLDELTAAERPKSTDSGIEVKGILRFEEAYKLFFSAFEDFVLPDRYTFRDELLSDELGLPVTLFSRKHNSFVVLNPENWDIVKLLDVFFDEKYEEKLNYRFELDASSLQTIMNSMDTEYDRSVVRAILASSSSCSQLYDVGLKPDTAVKNLKKVLTVSKEVENALDAGKDLLFLPQKEKKR